MRLLSLLSNFTQHRVAKFSTQVHSKYSLVKGEISKFLPPNRIIDDEVRRLAYGTDASFYRLIPQVVIDAESEHEVSETLKVASKLEVPITFRAAGTSLSGQAITDSILLRTVPSKWNKIDIMQNASIVKLKPAVIGSVANRHLAKYNKKIGPDPSSINACMIGGIAANNASGMCCGISKNTYRTVQDMRLIFSDGTLLDTSDPKSKAKFKETHSNLLNGLKKLSDSIKSNKKLAERIAQKYKIKNTTGYSLNALIDFEDEFEILKHIIIGSEGTLAFIAEITLQTVQEHPHKATSLIFFPDIITCCQAVMKLKKMPVEAVEMMDGASLRSAQSTGMIPKGLGDEVAALLVETRAESKSILEEQIQQIIKSLDEIKKLDKVTFSTNPELNAKLWSVRKGLLPMVGAMRGPSTSVITEDLAVAVPNLAAVTMDLQKLFKKFEYHDAVIFGHALEGNLHLVFSQNFETQSEINRYTNMMNELCQIVAGKFDGSLKAEHGTGRNMAPYVELEWGKEAYQIMWEIKRLFDPKNILNPGVILNEDKDINVKNLKPMPVASELIDKCMECGLCEPQCPSRELTLSPRQRIVVWREMERLKGQDETRLNQMKEGFEYLGEKTCAADGMCATSCPVSIDTGKLIKNFRETKHSPTSKKIAETIANRFSLSVLGARVGLSTVNFMHKIFGTQLLQFSADLVRKISGNRIPQWNPYIPKAAPSLKKVEETDSKKTKVVYFPTCVNRIMGPANSDKSKESLHQKIHSLLGKAEIGIVHPENINGLCCGLAFESKGYYDIATKKAIELEEALLKASDGGKYDILSDASPCVQMMRKSMETSKFLRIMEPVEFASKHLLPNLKFTAKHDKIVLHSPCSTKKMGIEGKLKELAQKCCNEVVDSEVPCCGMAGDRGLKYPELSKSALNQLKERVPKGCEEGYSTSKTCEIVLSLHSGVNFKSILYLLDDCTQKESKIV